MKEMDCPCKSNRPYEECCAPYHAKIVDPTPLEIVKARYSAYALQKIDYIIGTSHPELQELHRPFFRWRREIALFAKQTSFENLTILNVEPGPIEWFIVFRADLSQNGKDSSFTEKSLFKNFFGYWLYHSGYEVV